MVFPHGKAGCSWRLGKLVGHFISHTLKCMTWLMEIVGTWEKYLLSICIDFLSFCLSKIIGRLGKTSLLPVISRANILFGEGNTWHLLKKAFLWRSWLRMYYMSQWWGFSFHNLLRDKSSLVKRCISKRTMVPWSSASNVGPGIWPQSSQLMGL